jgi:pimeloyl-ACP methyl ester carboxylesterase
VDADSREIWHFYEKMISRFLLLTFLLASGPLVSVGQIQDFLNRVQHDYAVNDGVRIHYVTLGEGPLIVMLHGFPDYWLTWRGQMEVLSRHFQVVAMDLRGYNLSDKPEGEDNYAYEHLMGDVKAVIRANGREKAIVAGHDWGGSIAWRVAMYYPEVVEKLVVCNLPHPQGITAALAERARENDNQSYAEGFLAPDAHEKYTVQWMAGWVRDEEAKRHYLEALGRSDKKAMFNYYRANFLPGDQLAAFDPGKATPLPPVKVPVLLIHGIEDPYLPVEGINNTWKWVEQDLTMVTIPGAGHFVQQDASEMVTKTMKMWLLRDK